MPLRVSLLLLGRGNREVDDKGPHTLQAFILSTGADDEHPLFVNKSIDRALYCLESPQTCMKTTIIELQLLVMPSATYVPACTLPCAGRLSREARILYLDKLFAAGEAAPANHEHYIGQPLEDRLRVERLHPSLGAELQLAGLRV